MAHEPIKGKNDKGMGCAVKQILKKGLNLSWIQEDCWGKLENLFQNGKEKFIAGISGKLKNGFLDAFDKALLQTLWLESNIFFLYFLFEDDLIIEKLFQVKLFVFGVKIGRIEGIFVVLSVGKGGSEVPSFVLMWVDGVEMTAGCRITEIRKNINIIFTTLFSVWQVSILFHFSKVKFP